MSITKEHIKSLSRQFRLLIMAWLVESFQEEESEAGWMPSEEEKKRLEGIAKRMEEEGGKQVSSTEFRNRIQLQ